MPEQSCRAPAAQLSASPAASASGRELQRSALALNSGAASADMPCMALVTSEPAAAGSSPAAVAAPVAVSLDHVRRGFGEKPALVDLSISAPSGTITVLLGPNGAGKTTAIRMITGALSPEPARCTFGLDPSTDGEDVRRRCGVVSAKPALYDRLVGLRQPPLLGRAVRRRPRRPSTASATRPTASASSRRSTSRSAATRPA